MLSVTNKPFLLSVVMLNVIMLSVVMLNVIALLVFFRASIGAAQGGYLGREHN